jgi:hypothetical protein
LKPFFVFWPFREVTPNELDTLNLSISWETSNTQGIVLAATGTQQAKEAKEEKRMDEITKREGWKEGRREWNKPTIKQLVTGKTRSGSVTAPFEDTVFSAES